MHPLLPSLLAALLYLGATAYHGVCLARRAAPNKPLLLLLGLAALIAQCLGLTPQLLTDAGLVLDFFNAANLIAAAVIALTLLACLRIPVENLLLFLFPLGMLTAALSVLVPHGTLEPINEQPGILAHILLSVLAYGLLTIAVFQALLLLVQDHRLKHKHPAGLIRNFPPLQTMESLLFGIIHAGFVALLAVILTGFVFMDDMFAQHLVHKTFFTLLSTAVFGVLLWGRHRWGWRGRRALHWTLVGFAVLILAYFGSKFVLEVLLNRA